MRQASSVAVILCIMCDSSSNVTFFATYDDERGSYKSNHI